MSIHQLTASPYRKLFSVGVVVALTATMSFGDDAWLVEIRTLPVEPALDLVDITRDILEHPLIHDENKLLYLCNNGSRLPGCFWGRVFQDLHFRGFGFFGRVRG